MLKLQLFLISTFITYILIVIFGVEKSNADVSDKKDIDTWAIIGREYIEFTPEEMEWRRDNV